MFVLYLLLFHVWFANIFNIWRSVKKNANAESYVGLYQTSMTKLFRQNSQELKAVYIREKLSLDPKFVYALIYIRRGLK